MKTCPLCKQELPIKADREDIRKVVTVFKMVTGYDKDDKDWDKLFYPRYVKPAKQLIQFLGSWEWSADCIQDIYEKFSDQGFMVTMETIIKHSADWKKDKLEQEAKHGILSRESA